MVLCTIPYHTLHSWDGWKSFRDLFGIGNASRSCLVVRKSATWRSFFLFFTFQISAFTYRSTIHTIPRSVIVSLVKVEDRHPFTMSNTTTTPRLDGQSFKITVAVQSGMVDWDPSKTGNERASGYVIDILKSIASPNHANFTYDLFTPSGYGTLCTPQLERSNTTAGYSSVYFTQFNCGQSDVNDVPRSNTSTDMYVSSYYVSPSRQLTNQFTIPFAPPFQGTLGKYLMNHFVKFAHEISNKL